MITYYIISWIYIVFIIKISEKKMSGKESAFVFKITVIGDGAVGKTSLIKIIV